MDNVLLSSAYGYREENTTPNKRIYAMNNPQDG